MKILWTFPLCLGSLALANEPRPLKIRARENYEWIEMYRKHQTKTYESFSHTFNAWYEKPFQWALGFAFGPFGFDYQSTSKQEWLGSKMKLINYGLEHKYWFYNHVFTRIGIYKNYFDGHIPNSREQGISGLAGVGFEIPINGIGVALEYDRKTMQLQSGIKASISMVALGIHFYEWL